MDNTRMQQQFPFLTGVMLTMLTLLLPLEGLVDTDWWPVIKVGGGLVLSLVGGFLYKAGQAAFDFYFPDRRHVRLSLLQRWRNRRRNRRTELNLKDKD